MRLKAIAELAWRQMSPNPSDEVAITKEEFIASAKTLYAYEMWLFSKTEKRDEGMFELPTEILTESEPLPVVDDAIDISGLKILRAFAGDIWLQNIGGLTCTCKYVKSTVNRSQLLCGDDSLGNGARTYYIIKDKIYFPKGAHAKALSIIYADMGTIDDNVEVSAGIGAIIRQKLVDLYIGKTGKEDETNNSSSTT